MAVKTVAELMADIADNFRAAHTYPTSVNARLTDFLTNLVDSTEALSADLFDFQGSTDCSTNPNYPAASKGDAYVVSVAGKIGGGSGTAVDIGDVYVASADNAGGTQAAVGASWFILEHNLAGALLAANNLSELASAATSRTNLGLGTAAVEDVEFFATAAQGTAADTALQSADVGTAAAEDVGFFATAAQGTTADTTAALITSLYDHPGFIAGRWYTVTEGTTAGNGAATNDRVSLTPFRLPKTVTISDLGARINVGVALGTIQLAVYASAAATGLPDGAALAVTGDIAATTAGEVSGDITGANVTLQPGWYWAAINTSSITITMVTLANAWTFYGSKIGSTTLATITQAATLCRVDLSFPQTYGTWPTATGQTLTENTTSTAGAPILFIKAA